MCKAFLGSTVTPGSYTSHVQTQVKVRLLTAMNHLFSLSGFAFGEANVEFALNTFLVGPYSLEATTSQGTASEGC